MLFGPFLQSAFEGDHCRIVDRADQAGDIARRGRLAAAIGDAAPRLALEVDDEDIVLDDQHLAEMEIAMVADFEAVDVLAAVALQSLRAMTSAGPATRRPVAGRLPSDRLAPLRQLVERTFGARP